MITGELDFIFPLQHPQQLHQQSHQLAIHCDQVSNMLKIGNFAIVYSYLK